MAVEPNYKSPVKEQWTDMQTSNVYVKFFRGLLGAVMVLLLAPQSASANDCTQRYSFGTATLRTSDHTAGVYGADLSLLYGDWSWTETFGLTTDVAKSLYYVRDVAKLVRDCIGDQRAGRLNFSRRQVVEPSGTTRGETDAEYFLRIFDELVEVRREFATLETGYQSLLQLYAPLVPSSAVEELKDVVNETLLKVLQLSANRSTGIGWVVEHMQALTDATAQFQSAHALTNMLISTYLSQYPSLRDEIIERLENNTQSVLDQYGEFFSLEKRSALEALLAELDEQRDEEDLVALVANLSAIANQMKNHMDTIWLGPLRDMSSKLKFLFGGCDALDSSHPLTSPSYFGDLMVSHRIVQEGDNASFCAH